MRGTSATSLIPFLQTQTQVQTQVQANLSYYSPSSSIKSKNTQQDTPKSQEYNPLLSRFAQVMRLPSDARPAPPQSTIVKKIALASHMETEGNEKESYDIKLKTDLALLRINNILK